MRVPATASPPDCPRDLVIDADGLQHAAEVIRSAVEGGDGYEPASSDAVEDLIATLTAQVGGSDEPHTIADEHEQRVEQLIRDQSGVLQSLRHYSRLAVIGGAGTGKTWLALEQARRLSAEGQRVALVCYSRGLGRFLQRTTADWRHRPAYVGLFHDFALSWGAPGPTGARVRLLRARAPHRTGRPGRSDAGS
ncbi:PhoH family protein [Nocardioides dongxiaopingii]|uniref:PhoH family protein n=1 Tax=Nocardioides sp. S-1144 TaxID=2582905 RepID=UPI0016526811|nr:PhoH family protein [Nocardioides sp. S-1144]